MSFQALRNPIVAASSEQPYIPDEILLKIFANLPAETVLVCRRVCRRWKEFTSTQDFVRLHSSFEVPKFIWLDGKYNRWEPPKFFMVDSWGGAANAKETMKVPKLNVISRSPDPIRFQFSLHGLLIFSQEMQSDQKFIHFIIVNPLTGERVSVVTPPGTIFSAFLNPLNQYCLLWRGDKLRPDGSFRHRIIVLGGSVGGLNSQTQTQNSCCCWRELCDDAGDLVSYSARSEGSTMVGDVLYWMVGYRIATSRLGTSRPGAQLAHNCAESILAFNTKTEKFSVMPHPGPHNNTWCQEDHKHIRMDVVVGINEDHGRSRFLCFCESSLLDPVINMWILEQGQKQLDGTPSWIRWHTLDIHMFPELNSGTFVESIVNGEAYIASHNGIFAVNLKGVRARRITNEKSKIRSSVTDFSPCIASLGHCESEILWMSE